MAAYGMERNFLPQSVQTLTPESVDFSHLQKRQALADALMRSAMTPIDTNNRKSGRFVSAVSPFEGMAKLAEAYIGAKQHNAIEQQTRDLANEQRQRLIDSLTDQESIAPQERPSESLGAPYNAEAYDTKTPNPYNVPGATAPQWMDPTRPVSGLQANSVEVRGQLPQEQPQQQAPDRMAIVRNLAVQMLKRGASQTAVEQFLMNAQLKDMEQQFKPEEFETVQDASGNYIQISKSTGQPRQTGVRGEQKAPTFVDSGAGVDSSGRPLVVPKRWDAAQGKAVDVEGVQPVTKGPLATASASVSTKDAFKNERDLRNDLKSEPIYKAHQEVKAAFAQIKGSAGQNTPISDVALATKIMKLLDPGSVVRESELGIAMAASGLLDRVTNYANMVKTGQKLTPQQRTDFLKLADEFYSASEQQFNAKAAEYAGIAKDYNLNAGRVSGQAPSGKPGAKKGRHWVVGPDGSVTEQK